MKKPKNFNQVIDQTSYSTQIVVGGKGLYIKRNTLESDTDTDSTIWITDDIGFDKTPFSDHVLRITIYWDEFRMVVTRCKKGDGVRGDVIGEHPFIRKDMESWKGFKMYLSNRLHELYHLGEFGNK
jgi:hypothetical protein